MIQGLGSRMILAQLEIRKVSLNDGKDDETGFRV